jgi:hypothetical protein
MKPDNQNSLAIYDERLTKEGNEFVTKCDKLKLQSAVRISLTIVYESSMNRL